MVFKVSSTWGSPIHPACQMPKIRGLSGARGSQESGAQSRRRFGVSSQLVMVDKPGDLKSHCPTHEVGCSKQDLKNRVFCCFFSEMKDVVEYTHP